MIMWGIIYDWWWPFWCGWRVFDNDRLVAEGQETGFGAKRRASQAASYHASLRSNARERDRIRHAQPLGWVDQDGIVRPFETGAP